MQQVFAHPLPDAWSRPELIQDSIVADGLELHRVGMATRAPNGEEITGSAVEVGSAPVARSYFELLERISTLAAIDSDAPLVVRSQAGDEIGSLPLEQSFVLSDEPARWRYARSNGVAIHDSWANACQSAFFELVERDRVLRAWYGETQPCPIQLPAGSPFEQTPSYDPRAFTFPALTGSSWGRGVAVVGVFGFPKKAGLPLLVGYGARASAQDALGAAIRESLQALGFLWGEPLPSAAPPLGPTPAAHVETLLYPGYLERLREWLDNGHQRFARGTAPEPGNRPVTFLDLTPDWLEGLRVAKAVSADAAPLAFGDSPFVQHLPTDLRAHPIP